MLTSLVFKSEYLLSIKSSYEHKSVGRVDVVVFFSHSVQCYITTKKNIKINK